MSMRMFVAVVPPEDIKADLARFVDPRRDTNGPLRWVNEAQWHVTLAFLPAVHDRNLDELTQRLTDAAQKRHGFAMQIAGAGTFPNPAKAKAFWAGIGGDVEELEHLATNTRSAAAKSGAEVNGSKFRAHLTLARLNRPADVTKWLRVFETYRGPQWHVDEISLVESHLGSGTRGRSRYQTVERFPLR
jgi:2'-5' RNA ligase